MISFPTSPPCKSLHASPHCARSDPHAAWHLAQLCYHSAFYIHVIDDNGTRSLRARCPRRAASARSAQAAQAHW